MNTEIICSISKWSRIWSCACYSCLWRIVWVLTIFCHTVTADYWCA